MNTLRSSNTEDAEELKKKLSKVVMKIFVAHKQMEQLNKKTIMERLQKA